MNASMEASGTNMTTMEKGKLASDDTSENAKLLGKKRRVSETTANNLRLVILVKAWFEVSVLAVLSIVTLATSIYEDSSASFGFALSSFLDVTTSAVIIWRFFDSSKLYSPRTDRIANVTIGILFIVGSAIVMAKASYTLIERELPQVASFPYYYSIANCIICAILAVIGFYAAVMMESLTLTMDGINTVISLLFASSVAVSDAAYYRNERVWYIDALCGLAFSSFLTVLGILIIVYECHIKGAPEKEDT